MFACVKCGVYFTRQARRVLLSPCCGNPKSHNRTIQQLAVGKHPKIKAVGRYLCYPGLPRVACKLLGFNTLPAERCRRRGADSSPKEATLPGGVKRAAELEEPVPKRPRAAAPLGQKLTGAERLAALTQRVLAKVAGDAGRGSGVASSSEPAAYSRPFNFLAS